MTKYPIYVQIVQWFFMYLFVCGVYLRIDEYVTLGSSHPSIFKRDKWSRPRWRYPTKSVSSQDPICLGLINRSFFFVVSFHPLPSPSFNSPALNNNFQGVDPKVNIRHLRGGFTYPPWMQVSPISKLQQTCLETWHGGFHLSQVAAVWLEVAASDWHQEGATFVENKWLNIDLIHISLILLFHEIHCKCVVYELSMCHLCES